MKLIVEAILGLAIAHSAFAGDVDPDVLAGYGYYPSTTDQPPVCPDYPDFTGPSGTITSPGWPGDYPANSGCYWVINCGVQGVFPKVSVHWGDVVLPIIWAEDAGSRCGNGIHQHVAIKEPSCPSYKNDYRNGTSTRLEDLARADPRSSEYPGCIYVSSDGHILFYSYGYAGQGFEIKYECPQPCEDEQSPKYCKKALKKGKCKKAGVAKKCKKTCDKCDEKGARYLGR